MKVIETSIQRSYGFSLVELSIVLVILGLLVGGILAGQSLIRAAELRSVVADHSRYVSASNTFRDKYFALPGDMTNATAFWGATAACPGTAGTGTQTCNGNGNGQIDGPASVSQYGEWFTYWQHLASAGLIEGNYSGRAGPTYLGEALGGTNVPKTKLQNGGWMVSYDAGSTALMFPVALARNNFRLGGLVSGSWAYNPIFKPEEIWNLDTKLDDGKPGTGLITSSLSSWNAGCTSSTDPATAAYNLSTSTMACLFFGGL